MPKMKLTQVGKAGEWMATCPTCGRRNRKSYAAKATAILVMHGHMVGEHDNDALKGPGGKA